MHNAICMTTFPVRREIFFMIVMFLIRSVAVGFVKRSYENWDLWDSLSLLFGGGHCRNKSTTFGSLDKVKAV